MGKEDEILSGPHAITLLEARNPVWRNEEGTRVDAEVQFSHFPVWAPFSAVDGSGETHVQEAWDRITRGEFGEISAFHEREPLPEPVPDDISRRQFFQQLFVLEIITKPEALTAIPGLNIPPPLQAIIDQLPTQSDRDSAEMLVVGAQNFNRLHPLSETVRLSLGWSVEQKDDFWREASKL